MTHMLLTDFLKQYPTCPLCSGPIDKEHRTLRAKDNHTFELLDFRCAKNGHYEVRVNTYVKDEDAYDNLYVNSIQLITAWYDISIFPNDDKIFVAYSPDVHNETERRLKCEDISKWMISHDAMMDKLKVLWSLA